MPIKKPLEYVLSTGLKILLCPQSNLTTATALLLVKNGTDYETPKTNGISHFIEHLIFKGSGKFPSPSALATELDKLGAEYNAFTSYEYTGYYIKTFPDYLNPALEILSDIVTNPLFPKDEINKERKVVLEEINYTEDTPTRFIHDLMLKNLYDGKASGMPILGPKENIKNFERKEISKFYQAHYSPKNSLLIIAGDIDTQKTLRLVEKYFSEYKRPAAPKKKDFSNEQQGFRFYQKKKDVKQGHLMLAFSSEGTKHLKEKRFTLGVLASILGFGFSSRMFQLLREKLGATYYLSVDFELFSDRGYLYVQTGADLERLREIVGLTVNELSRLKFEKVSDDELSKAKAVLENHLLMSTETSDALASFYGAGYFIEGQIMTPKEVINAVKKVKSDDVMHAAQKYLTTQRANMVMIGPKVPKVDFENIFDKI
ncbi:MAG: M16 family peptidase [Parcubacteria group bacterium GW2011_GWC1_41_7]|nr:MAG: M16 family peptidase [Parcubacteria group bacterium GW2011_GWC1_41_7]